MTSPLELAANFLNAIAIVLAGRNNVHTWWTGIVGCSLFALVFYDSHLYADVALQGFFVGTSFIGWWQWLRGAGGQPLTVTHANFRSLLWTVPVGLAATAAYGVLLHRYTNAYAPFLDSAVLVFSVIAQILIMQRRIENWAFWLLVNSIAVPLYFSRGLYLTSLLYAGYWVNAAVAWRLWNRLATAQAAERRRAA
ncbi:MAG TPA: nicotinamide riboside transporter PnuC [Telluria sp.]|nr:nicotinamide riboside transporter PnuC [Telluria sp.]